MKKINIALVDDHSIVIDGITSLLIQIENMQVVGKANSKETLFEILTQQPVDLILLDLYLPKPIGFEILKDIRKKYPEIKVIILSGNEEEELIVTAFQNGASAYLTKNIERNELQTAINKVMSDEKYLSHTLEKLVSKNFIKRATSGDKYAHHKLTGLSPREMEIVILLCDGLSFKEISNRLDISTRTVEAHKNNILEKLALDNTIDLVKFAVKNKLIEL